MLKIADFGFAKACEAGKLTTYLGTASYMAPEIHLRQAYDGKSVDLFAAGIVLFIMYSGTPPFGKALPSDPYYKLLCTRKQITFWAEHSRNKPKDYYSAEFKDLIQGMFQFDPKLRPTLDQVKGHPWFKKEVLTQEEITQRFAQRKQQIEEAHERERLARIQVMEGQHTY